MKFPIYILLLFITGLSSSNDAFSQSKICICFDKNTKHIKYGVNKDSTLTSFGITNKGYESEELRKKAIDEYNQNVSEGIIHSVFTPQDAFITNYMSNRKPKKIISVEDANCAIIITVEEFRQKKFVYPQGTGGSQIIFIEKVSDNSFLKWDAVLMALE